jgi:ADP-heptose:LPS heptosyltransferase
MKPSLSNNKILFIRLRLLGDIIFTIPAIEIFKNHFPEARAYYVVEEPFREIAELIPGLHRLIVIPRHMSIRSMWKFRKEIRKNGIDTVVDFHSGPKSAQLTRLTGAKLRIGYQTPNRNWAYHRLTPRKFGDTYTHSVFNQAKLLEHLGIPVQEEALPPYPAIKVDETCIPEWLKQAVTTGKKAVIHVGAGNVFRDWGIENFSTLIRQLKDDGITLFLIGNGTAEKQRGEELGNRFGIANLVGKLSIAGLLYLVSHASVYVGADSGPLHVASLTTTPLVALYGPNIPEISGPWRKNRVTILQVPLDCRPCSQRTCIYGIIPCMKNITTEKVYEAINRYLR